MHRIVCITCTTLYRTAEYSTSVTKGPGSNTFRPYSPGGGRPWYNIGYDMPEMPQVYASRRDIIVPRCAICLETSAKYTGRKGIPYAFYKNAVIQFCHVAGRVHTNLVECPPYRSTP